MKNLRPYLELDMEILLPEIIQFDNPERAENGWSDHYGALYVAASYCGIELPELFFPHFWQHGCFGPWVKDCSSLIFNIKNPKNRKLFVAREDQASVLSNSGMPFVYSIGLPIIYVPDPHVKRVSNSLLIMPQHTLVGLSMGNEFERTEYVKKLKDYISSFDIVAACVSPSCIKNGYYVNALTQMGVDIIPGAFTSDLNALLRIRCLMEQFETMTTNYWGSHMAYALYFGMKVSVFGKKFEIPLNELIQIDTSYKDYTEEDLKRKHQKETLSTNTLLDVFSVAPDKGIQAKSLGAWLVGSENRICQEEMKFLFDWN
jgi:hypothetical protein